MSFGSQSFTTPTINVIQAFLRLAEADRRLHDGQRLALAALETNQPLLTASSGWLVASCTANAALPSCRTEAPFPAPALITTST